MTFNLTFVYLCLIDQKSWYFGAFFATKARFLCTIIRFFPAGRGLSVMNEGPCNKDAGSSRLSRSVWLSMCWQWAPEMDIVSLQRLLRSQSIAYAEFPEVLIFYFKQEHLCVERKENPRWPVLIYEGNSYEYFARVLFYTICVHPRLDININ